MTAQPAVTIGVPVYNGERYLAGALDQLLAQQFHDFEIVISDNGSRDLTSTIARAYAAGDDRIRYVRYDDTVDPVRSFNRALSHARGRFFVWAAVDDGRRPDAIGACVAALEREPLAVMAHGPVVADVVNEQRQITIPHAMDLTSPDAAARVRTYTRELSYNAILYGLYRTDVLRRATFRYHPGHDYTLPLQVLLHGPAAYTDTPMLTYRHVWGEVDTPMYRLERMTLRDLVVYRGIRRRKCVISLAFGAWFLLTQPGVRLTARARATAAHVRSFVGRYGRHLAAEAVFLAFTPLVYVAAPLVPAGRRLKRSWLGTVAAR